MSLNPETVLKRRPYLRLTLNSGDEVQVSADGKSVKCGLHALSILELFSEPLSVADAIKQLAARAGAGKRVAAIATLFRLYENGMLRDVSAPHDDMVSASYDSGATTTSGDNNDSGENFAADEIYFECSLDEPPLDLIPYREREAREGREMPSLESLTLNSNVALQTGGDAPAHLAARLPFLDRFSPRRPVVWVEDAGTHALAPYWLKPERARLIEQLKSGTLTPSELDTEVAARFASAQILIAPDAEAARAESWERTCEDLRRDLQTKQHAVLRKIIHPLQLAALRRYFRALDERGQLKASSNKHYAHNRRSIYDEETSRFVQHQITALVNRITHAPVSPSHCQVSVYKPGAFLRRHKDQPQYVWNLSLVVDAVPETDLERAWPICMEVEGRTQEVRLEIGDAVLYRGSEFTHWRDVLPDGQSVTLLFCFFSPANA
ncbi:MAG TPA: hypothetical protein VJ842_10440 [Pyrinomonadaceae bacterium]|nr:hypothetical protein [Pyrinomonadaceae bacterium]